MRTIHDRKPLEYYLNLKYPVLLYEAEEGGYVAEIEELPGCITQAESSEQAIKLIEEARHDWIEVAYEAGEDIPLPRHVQQYSGKFLIRLPKSLHRRLAETAASEGVSLNQYVLWLLSSRNSEREIPSHFLGWKHKQPCQSYLDWHLDLVKRTWGEPVIPEVLQMRETLAV